MDRRNFIKLGALGTIILGSGIPACNFQNKGSSEEKTAEIGVVGGTPAGIMAAIAASRAGSKVMLMEHYKHVGGMSTNGLGKSDITNKEAIAGLFQEFTQRVLRYYEDNYGKDSENVKLCKDGYYYEPSVAEQVFNQMIREEKNITVLLNHQLEKAVMKSDKIDGAVFKDKETGEKKTIKANVFIDATYEGDLYALAGAEYRLGREGRNEFSEKHAGHIFFDYEDKVILDGSTGKGDDRLPAYTYRLCMTDDPDNSYVLKDPPPGYNRENYLDYFNDLKEGRLSAPKEFKEGYGYYKEHFDTMVRVFSFTELPNRKYDVNMNPRPLGFPFVEENYEYPESDWKGRQKIFKRLRELTLGLIYFVQNDSAVPKEHRELARKYHLPLDEFIDNEHFPWQLYIREARRLKGQYTLTESDVRLQGDKERNTIFHDSVITGEFPIDSFPVSDQPSPDRVVLEGYIGMLEIPEYQVPYRILIPEKIQGLIVPVAASATHIGFSTLRMEPLWMGIGQVAGMAAHLAINRSVDVKEIPLIHLQNLLINNDQIITYFKDIDKADKAFRAVQFWGTKGFFDSYYAKVKDPLRAKDLGIWLDKFHETMNIDQVKQSASDNKEVRISYILNLIKELGKKHNLWNEANPSNNKLGQFDLNPEKWLYKTREHSFEVLRGEACLALYNLFMAIYNQKKSL
jgi:hypothetical protein